MNRRAFPIALLLVATVAPLSAAHAPREERDDFAEEQAAYEEYLRRAPLLMHVRGREYFAQTQDPRALQILADSYARPEKPEEQVRYLLASICTRSCSGPEHMAIYDAWRAEHDDPRDAWLWYRTLCVKREVEGPDAVVELARGGHHVFLRAAAIEALAAGGEPVLLELIPELIERALPKKTGERAVLIGALGTALRMHQADANTPEFRSAAVAFAHLLDESYDLPLSTRLVVARHLAYVYDMEELLLESGAWINVMAGKARKPEDEERYVKPKFFGLEGGGARLCYVIDMSDSMCKKLDPASKPKGPTTGPRKRKQGEPPTEADIPWHLVETRFDLAREHLKLSLRSLGKNQSFCVIWFGDKADMLRGCTGMMPASRSNVSRVIKELDGVKPGAPTPFRPDGTLRGKTNLHGGLRRAFMLKDRGFTKRPEYVDLATYEQGCDTIFLLSDGEPTWDDWGCEDVNYGEDLTGDPESHLRMAEGDRLLYPGPYQQWLNVLEDAERMNLFREVELHCIGIGEANAGMLEQLAELGLGEAQILDY